MHKILAFRIIDGITAQNTTKYLIIQIKYKKCTTGEEVGVRPAHLQTLLSLYHILIPINSEFTFCNCKATGSQYQWL